MSEHKQNILISYLHCFLIPFLLADPSTQSSSAIAQIENLVINPKKNNAFQSSQDAEGKKISDWRARLELARVLSYLKRYDESIQEYLKLLQLKPNSSLARREYASVLFYIGKTDESLEEFSKVPPNKLDDKSKIVIADLLRKKKNYSQAEEIYGSYLKKSPEDDKVRLKLAELLSWQKRYGESVFHYRILLSHHPKDIQLRRRYAQVLTWMGQEEEAVEEWKKTLP